MCNMGSHFYMSLENMKESEEKHEGSRRKEMVAERGKETGK